MAWQDESEPSEADRITAWRLGCLLDAGYALRDAEQLAADTTIDLHQALALVEAGCLPSLAVSILS